MIEFLNKLFGRQNSGATAKERLRLVLMSDHLSLAPEMIDAMKRDLIEIISRYVEVDREKIDVHFEHEDHGLAMLASIPITGVNRNNGDGNGSGDKKVEQTADTRDSDSRHGEVVEPPPSAVEARASASGNGQRRRKRRKGGSGSPAPAT